MLLLCIFLVLAGFALVWLAGEWAVDGDVNGPRPGAGDAEFLGPQL